MHIGVGKKVSNVGERPASPAPGPWSDLNVHNGDALLSVFVDVGVDSCVPTMGPGPSLLTKVDNSVTYESHPGLTFPKQELKWKPGIAKAAKRH